MEIDLMHKISEWQRWNEKYERAEFEKVWNKKEATVQDQIQERRREILEKAQKPAFTAQKFTLVQVISPFSKTI